MSKFIWQLCSIATDRSKLDNLFPHLPLIRVQECILVFRGKHTEASKRLNDLASHPSSSINRHKIKIFRHLGMKSQCKVGLLHNLWQKDNFLCGQHC